MDNENNFIPSVIRLNNNFFNILNNNDDGNNDHGVSEEFKNNLAENIVDEEFIKNEKQCSICLDDFKLNDKYIKLPCSGESHFFHSGDENCSGIKPWLERNNTCPMCRTEFPKDEQNNILNNNNIIFETLTFHIQGPNIDNQNIDNQNIDNPNIENPNIENPNIDNPNIDNPNIDNPNIDNINPNNLINRMDNIIRNYINEIQETNEQRELQMAIEASLNDT